MAREKAPEEQIKTDGWMATFSDLMNLLLCFFVLLFSMSSVDAEKFQEVLASFATSFGVLSGGGTGIGDGALIASGASQLTQLSEYYASMGLNNEGDTETIEGALDTLQKVELDASEQIGDNVSQAVDEKGLSDVVEIQVTQHYVSLNMKGALLFESGSATLTKEASEVLTVVSEILVQYEDNLIEIEGHTDNIPIDSGIFTSNDVLSAYRALSVFQFVVQQGVDPTNLKHTGRGEYNPIASNETAEGRAQNRRVEIKIFNSYSSYE